MSHTPWWSQSNNGKCQREILDTPPSEVDKVGREKLQWLQTLSSRSFHKSTTSTIAKGKNGRQHAFSCDWCGFRWTGLYCNKRKDERKAYVVLYSCSLTRGVFLELLPSLETSEFVKSLKRLITRRGRPSRVYSDNGQTFVTAAKWLKKVQKDEEFHSMLSKQSILWQFNLSRAPWWGGQFNYLIGLMKPAFYKTVGQGLLSWEELSEVILDIEVSLNNRPLCYLEEDIQLPTLTPNTMLFLNSNILPELQPYQLEERDLRKRAKFLQKNKRCNVESVDSQLFARVTRASSPQTWRQEVFYCCCRCGHNQVV